MDFVRLVKGDVIEEKVDSQVGGLPNIEEPTMVQK